MGLKKGKLNEIGKNNPFKVPKGYFERFSEEMISLLPERAVVEPQVISMWERFKPWVYMAAMFVGIALMVKVFVVQNSGTDKYHNLAKSGILLHSDADIEDFYNYYEDQVVTDAYNETAYLVSSGWE